MKTIKVNHTSDIPQDHTGVADWNHGNKEWYKNGEYHREDGPARIFNGYKSWWLDGKIIWNSGCKLNLTNQIILSKQQHSEYPTVQIWKILGPNGLYEQIIIPGMEVS